MEKSLRRRKPIPLFSAQAVEILGRPLQLLSSSDRWREEEEEAEPHHGAEQQDDTHTGTQDIRQPGSSSLLCLSCGVGLSGRGEQVVHYRLDWHRYNLKRRLGCHAPLSQEEFERVAGDLSSISGSESDSDETPTEEREEEEKATPPEPRPQGSPFLHFKTGDGSSYAVYRSVLLGGKASLPDAVLTERLGALGQPQVWIILMKAGGHFAGGVFKNAMLVAHKTFHRYTVRAKRGTAQSVRDSQQGGHQPKSAGASLRRHNEAALEQEIQDLIASWSQYVEHASAIFIRTPKYNKSIFSGGKKSPFSREDPRLRTIPFMTRRPTQQEVKSVHTKLAAVYTGGPCETVQKGQRSPNPQRQTNPGGENSGSKASQSAVSNFLSDTPPEVTTVDEDRTGPDGVAMETPEQDSGGKGRAKRKRKQKNKKSVATETGPAIPPEVQRLLGVCEEGDSEALASLLEGMGLHPLHSDPHPPSDNDSDDALDSRPTCTMTGPLSEATSSQDQLPEVLNALHSGQTPLHLATASGYGEIVRALLHYGANPAIRDSSGRPPYAVAKERSVRDVFRRFMGEHPSAYDYTAAQVPSPLTEAMERGRREKVAERKRAQKKAKKRKEKEQKVGEEDEQSQETHSQAVASLSEREKRALAAERRMAQQLPTSSTAQRSGVCRYCGCSLAGVVPFERLQYKYCSMACLKEHRTQLARTQ